MKTSQAHYRNSIAGFLEASDDSGAVDQVWDYALDLKNVLEPSHTARVVPVLIATEAAVPRAIRYVDPAAHGPRGLPA